MIQYTLDEARRAYEVILRHFEDWKIHPDEEHLAVQMSLNARHLRFDVRVRVEDDVPVVMILLLMGILAPEKKRAAAAVAIARLNYGLMLGRFEIDMSDGEIKYVTAIPFAHELDEEVFRHAFGASVCTADKQVPALLRVLHGNADPMAVAAREDTETEDECEDKPASSPDEVVRLRRLVKALRGELATDGDEPGNDSATS